MRYLLVALWITGCARGGSPETTDGQPGDARSGDGRPVDAAVSASDSRAIDAQPVAPGTQLLLTEVAIAGTEFIEVYNPTTQTVDLSHYYLSDSSEYYKLPAGVPTVTSGDFIVHFPPGASLASKGVATVAIGAATAFNTSYGRQPDYSITDMTMTTTTVVGAPSLTNTGEPAVLFFWDGSSHLVQDVDIMLVGVPATGNLLANKSGYSQGGSSYKTDANTIAAQPSAPAAGTSTKRIATETGHETQNGSGNGVTGDDETSENTGATWDTTFTAPTPGLVPAAL